MKINQIYKKFQIPQNLCKHMLRVAGLANILADNWIGKKLNIKALVVAGLLHDIAKPLNFNLKKQAKFGMSTLDIKKLKKLQNYIRKKYGNDEHSATVGITRDLGCSLTVVKFIDNLEWSYIPKLLDNKILEPLILIYSDMRIGPKGILSIKQRLTELKKRLGNENINEYRRNGILLEKLVQSNVSIKVKSITNKQINNLFKRLLKKSLIC